NVRFGLCVAHSVCHTYLRYRETLQRYETKGSAASLGTRHGQPRRDALPSPGHGSVSAPPPAPARWIAAGPSPSAARAHRVEPDGPGWDRVLPPSGHDRAEPDRER